MFFIYSVKFFFNFFSNFLKKNFFNFFFHFFFQFFFSIFFFNFFFSFFFSIFFPIIFFNHFLFNYFSSNYCFYVFFIVFWKYLSVIPTSPHFHKPYPLIFSCPPTSSSYFKALETSPMTSQDGRVHYSNGGVNPQPRHNDFFL